MAYMIDIIVGDTGEGFIGYSSDSGIVHYDLADGLAAFRQKLKSEDKKLPEDFEHLKINLRKLR